MKYLLCNSCWAAVGGQRTRTLFVSSVSSAVHWYLYCSWSWQRVAPHFPRANEIQQSFSKGIQTTNMAQGNLFLKWRINRRLFLEESPALISITNRFKERSKNLDKTALWKMVLKPFLIFPPWLLLSSWHESLMIKFSFTTKKSLPEGVDA